MMNLWTVEERTKILLSLDNLKLPFEEYSFTRNERDALKILGTGGSAEVYEAITRKQEKSGYAIKVIGFRNGYVDSDMFKESVQVQKDIGDFRNDVVKIYDYTELWVILDDDDNVISAVKQQPKDLPHTSLKLQFVVMEKLRPVFNRTKAGIINLFPERLNDSNEQDVLRLAYDVGKALERAHEKYILHRDVKLENVFYSEKERVYKLGDFGIAKRTYDGFASTVALTKGYAAPEVIHTQDNDKYDYTADIYSFGMMLFVLMNEMKFPESNTYNVNYQEQYKSGFILPWLDNASDGFNLIIEGCCCYNPDERFQSMKEVLGEIERLLFGENVSYQKSNANTYAIVGAIFLAFGVVMCKLTILSQFTIHLSFGEYIFLVLCLGKGIQKIYKRDVIFLSVIVFCIGVYLVAYSGFSWIKLVLLLLMTFSSGTTSGYISASVFTAQLVSLIQLSDSFNFSIDRHYSWIAVFTIIEAFVLIYYYDLLKSATRTDLQKYYKKAWFWPAVCVLYLSFIFLKLDSSINVLHILDDIAIYRPLFWLIDYGVDFLKVGIAGLLFSIFWIIREKIIIHHEKKGFDR